MIIAYLFFLLAIFLLFQALFVSAQGNSVSITNPLNGVSNFADLLKNMITQVGLVIASLATIMIVVAGVFYLTSAGSPERIGMAKKTLSYAIIGLIIGITASIIPGIIKSIIGAS